MDNMKKTTSFMEYIDEVYEKAGYLDKYGLDFLITIIVLFMFFLPISYFYVMSKAEPIRADWQNQRCHPAVIPFAGWIAQPKNQTYSEFTSENFGNCVNGILAKIVGYFVKPIYYLTDNIVGVFSKLAATAQIFRKLMASLRNKIMKIVEHIMGKILNVFIPVQKILIKFKDALAKTVGALTAGLYTIMAIFLSIKAFMGSFLSIIIAMLVLAIVAIIALWILPFTWPMAAAGTTFFLLISIPTAIIAGWMVHILNLTSRSVPSKPGRPACFDKNTTLKTSDGEKSIKNIKPGDILLNGAKITAVFKCALNNQQMYNINGVIVSETHKIFHDKMGWIFIKQHPEATLVKNYSEKYIYCINTDDKRIHINNLKFLDWDEIEPVDIILMKKLNYLTDKCSIDKIHKNFDSGLTKETKIELENGNLVDIRDVKVNDQIKIGGRVLAKVKINAKDLSFIRKYSLNGFTITGSPNIIINDFDLGKLKTINMAGTVVLKKDKYLYHLITENRKFKANNIIIQDYDSAIENIIDKHNQLLKLF
jgi:hypothetical protein